MTISTHAEVFAGKPVKAYALGDRKPFDGVYRLSLEYDSKLKFDGLLGQFLDEHGGESLTALVVGSWGEGMDGADRVVKALVDSAGRMPRLKALYLGDITFEECEMSWINWGDVSKVLPAFANLEEFRLRGTTDLVLGDPSHAKLKSFALESGGLDAGLIEAVLNADFPNLMHLELWLGDRGYGAIEDADVLEPLFEGGLFPRLVSLGLRNAEIADEIARRLADSPLLARLKSLDMSLGNLGDEGGEALLASPALRKLTFLDLHHHYLSEAVMAKFKSLGISVDLDEAEGSDTKPEDRYVTVGE